MSTALHQKTTLLFSAKILRFEYRPSPENHIAFSLPRFCDFEYSPSPENHAAFPRQDSAALSTAYHRKTTPLFPAKILRFEYSPSPENHTTVLRKDSAF
ncbi:MAG: hypothetical protein IJS39_16630 [Synergistaceae bacterium]|nr:hypothetical protein [Synergistaceae bacterium]